MAIFKLSLTCPLDVSDSNYANTLLAHARKLFNFAYNYKKKYTESIPNAGSFYQWVICNSAYVFSTMTGYVFCYVNPNPATRLLITSTHFPATVADNEIFAHV